MKTHLDLFSGIGGFALAAQWAGYRIVSADRLERLQDTTAAAKEFTDTLFLMTDMSNEQSVAVARDLGVLIAEAVLRLRPGDLDAGESEAGR